MLLDERLPVETPEGVHLELVLAGLGSRFIARLLDTTIQLAIILALLAAVFVTAAPGVARAVVFVVVFLVMFFYDVPFELYNEGRTIGKVTAGIRVVGGAGEPVSFLASAVRNIMRIIDFLPVLYAVGAVSIIATRHDQRLGDLAAGTVVIRDRFPGITAFPPTPITVPADAVVTWDVSAVSNDDVATIRYFLERRTALPWEVRDHFGHTLAARFAGRIAGAPSAVHPEYLLEGIVVAKQQRR